MFSIRIRFTTSIKAQVLGRLTIMYNDLIVARPAPPIMLFDVPAFYAPHMINSFFSIYTGAFTSSHSEFLCNRQNWLCLNPVH